MGKASRKKRAQKPERHGGAGVTPASHEKATELARIDYLLAAIAAVVAGGVYWRTLCATIYTSGAGENVTAAATLGIPHPPGFPLFCLLGKLFILLFPFGEVAYRVNVFSAACAALAVAFLFVVLRWIGGSGYRAAALTSALLFAFSRTFWSQAVIAEVYTLNALLLLLIFFFLLRWDSGASLFPAAFCFGLGLAVHPLQVLFLPGWLYFIWRSKRKSELNSSTIARSLAFVAPGLLLHLYTPIRSSANPLMDWGNPENARNFVAYLTASQYRERMFSLPLQKVLSNFVEGANLLVHQFTPWLFALPLAGGWLVFRNNRRIFWMTFLPAVVTILYAVNYNIPWEIDVYYIPVALILGLWSFWILVPIAQKLNKLAFALAFVAFLPLLLNFLWNDRSKHRLALAYGTDLLRSCPTGANLIVPDTDAVFALLYLKAVEGKRPDLNLWIETSGGLKSLPNALNPQVRAITYYELTRQESAPIFISHRLSPEAIPGFALVPSGIVQRIVNKGTKISVLPEFGVYELEKYANSIPTFYLDDRSKVILADYLLSRGDYFLAKGSTDKARDDYAKAEEIAGDIGEIKSEIAAREADTGDTVAAIRSLREAVALQEKPGDYNRLGRLLAQTGQMDEAMSAFRRAIELDPNFGMAHSNLGAAYGAKGDLTNALQELETALRLDPNNPLAHNNLARASLLAGNRDRAIAALRQSLAIDPAQPQVRKQLQQLGVQP